MNDLMKDGRFAAASQPVRPDYVQTDSEGLECGRTTLPIDGAAVPLYFARPAGKPQAPVVLVVSEIFGLHEHIADVVRRFAKRGYFALAPDLFVRQGDPASEPDMSKLMKTIVARTPDEQVMRDLDACVDWAQSEGGNIGKLAVTGFCWGGRMTWLYAAHNPKVKAGVAWYGRIVGAADSFRPRHPIDHAATLTVPVLGLYGGRDDSIPLQTVHQMQAALALGSSGSHIHVYPEAGHAFYADYRPSYVAAAASDGITRCLDWLRTHGVA